jgi:hypothetical protein
MRHLRDFIGSRKAGVVVAVSDLALIIGGPDKAFAQDGISPHRINDISRWGCVGFWRMTGTGWVGAMLYRGVHSGSSDTVSKYSSTSCFLRDNL